MRFLAFVVCVACGAAPVKQESTLASRVDTVAAEIDHNGFLAGASVAVARNGEVVLARGYGYADLAAGTLVNPNTRYRIASISKLITAVAVLQLAEAGKLSIDDAVVRFFPELPANVTVKHLLSHTSGLRDFTGLPGPFAAPADVVPAVAKARAEFAPGERFDYSNTNFLLLGLIVERVTGRPLADVLAERVFGPAGMRHTALGCAGLSTVGYARQGKTYVPAPPLAVPPNDGSASVCSTASDLALFAQALVAGKLVRPETFALMKTPIRADIPFGLGMELRQRHGRTAFGHPGGGGGFAADLTHYDDGVTVVVLTNGPGALVRLRHHATLAALGIDDRPPPPRPLSPAERSRFAGDYRFPNFVLHVYERGDDLWARINDPDGERLAYFGDGLFGGTTDEPEIRIRLVDEAGRWKAHLDYYGTLLDGERQ